MESSASTLNFPRQLKFIRSPIPRSRSEFCYVHLNPKEKRSSTDFTHFIPQFNKDPPYVRLLDSAIVEQPTNTRPQPPSRMCRSSTGTIVSKVPNLDGIRSESMRSLKRTVDSSPSKYTIEETVKNDDQVPPDFLEDDLTRLRNFSITPKGLVNWGDSFRSRSMPFVPAYGQSTSLRQSSSGTTLEISKSKQPVSLASGSSMKPPSRHKIVILGSSNVGKTTMIKQFRTSEYMCPFDTSNGSEESDSAITVVLNGVESELEFVDTCSVEEEETDEGDEASPQSKPYIPTSDAYVVVYSVTSRRSFLHALHLVSRIQSIFLNSVILLVGNKSDLVRIRAVTTDEGQSASRERNCPFLETSVAINHQVDELLVAILTEIRDSDGEREGMTKLGSPHHCSLTRAKGLLKKFLKKACFQSKSCDNLQRL